MDAKPLVWESELDFCAEKKEGRTRSPPLLDQAKMKLPRVRTQARLRPGPRNLGS
jgi:hypothetical protein